MDISIDISMDIHIHGKPAYTSSTFILADSIHSDVIHFIFIATRLFYDKKNWHDIILLYDK